MQLRTISLIIISLMSFAALAQSDITIEEIKSSGNYIYGIGYGATIPDADEAALHHLSTQISVEVKGSFESQVTEKDGELTEYAERVINTYSNTRLERAKMKVIADNDEQTQVMRYITKQEMNQLFEDRKQKVLEYFLLGQEAEQELRIGDALKNYYWSLALLRSHPDNNKIRTTVDEKERTLLPVLNAKIEQLLGNLSFSIGHVFQNEVQKKKSIEIQVTYQNKKVRNIDYKYFTGDVFSQLISVKDGKGVIELFDASARSLEKVQLYVEYKYEHKWNIDDAVRRVMQNTNLPGYGKSKVKLNISSSSIGAEVHPEKGSNAFAHQQANELKKQLALDKSVSITRDVREELIAKTMKVVSSLQSKSSVVSRELFTDDGYMMYQKLLQQGKVNVLFNDTSALYVLKVNNTWAVRSVPMTFAYPSNNRKFVEDVVFTFDSTKRIDAVSFALSQLAIDDVLMKNKDWGSLQEKYTLIHFMEDYKTAYSLKRLDYLEKVFAENALIIVGHVLKDDLSVSSDLVKPNFNKQRVEYIKLNKEEYLERLSRSFRSKEYINLDFADNEVFRLQSDKIFGIQINQQYYSSNYADKGYLFLMVDLKDTLNPKIYVRSWQPEKFKDGTIIGLKDFHF